MNQGSTTLYDNPFILWGVLFIGTMESNVSVAYIYTAYSSLDPYNKTAVSKTDIRKWFAGDFLHAWYWYCTYFQGLIVAFLIQKLRGENPTRSFRMLSLATSSGKVYRFNIEIRDEYTNKNLYESKRRSPGGPDPKHHWITSSGFRES